MSDFPSFTKVIHHKSYPSISPDRADLSADGKVVLITGAGSGIGRATAIAFAQAKARVVVLCGRRVKPLGETKAAIQSLGFNGQVVTHVLDILQQDNVEVTFGVANKHVGPIDIVINAAGHLAEAGSIKDTSFSNFWTSFEVHVKGAFFLSQAFLKYCVRDNGKDRVLTLLSSLLAHFPASQVTTAPASYCISKLAEAKLAEFVASENTGLVRAYALQLGVVETEMSSRSLAMAPEGTRESLNWDDADLSAHFMLWLASSRGTAMPSGRYLWINWDVEELEARSQEMKEDPFLLSMTMGGWPFDGKVRG